ncbi:MAG: glycosyltransferase family 39 protein [Candidatus Omnitrophica bacterium]|nr:glycosyltransferase family 39 protein [Candidatus Omnitrophota bacterium]
MTDNSFQEKIDKTLIALSSRLGCVLVISAGIIIRSKLLFENCSLWLDEAWVAMDILSRPFIDIVLQVYTFQDFSRPPLLFLIISKLFVNFLGNHEMSLRFLPFLSSIVSLLIFYRLLNKYVDRRLIIFGLILISFCGYAVRYSVELKQYSTDLLAGLVVLSLSDLLRRKEIWALEVELIGIVFSAIMLFSNAAIFVIAGVLVTYFISACINRDNEKIRGFLFLFIIVISVFILIYKFSLEGMVNSDKLTGYWSSYFLPEGSFIKKMEWLKDSVISMFLKPLGINWPVLGLGLFSLGLLRLFKKDKTSFFVFILPFILVMAAAIIRKYPFGDRLVLFLVPFLIIMILNGIEFLMNKSRFFYVLALIAVFLLIIYPVKQSWEKFNETTCFEENREVMKYFADNFRIGDHIFINDTAVFTLAYYLDYYGMKKRISMDEVNNVKGGKYRLLVTSRIFDNLAMCGGKECLGADFQFLNYSSDYRFRTISIQKEYEVYYIIEKIPDKMKLSRRNWVFLSHVPDPTTKLVLKVFDGEGKRIDYLKKNGAGIYLYEINDLEP